MFGRKRQTTRFSLLLLEEGEDYVKDWVAHCEWPSKVTGNWQGKEKLEGRLRLCSKSLMFDADDSRVPIVRLPFRSAQRLEGTGDRTFVIDCAVVVKMKQDCADAPYVFQKGEDVVWRFALAYDTMESFMPLAQEQLAVSRLPLEEAEKILKVLEQHREDAMEFDRSELVDFNERILYDAPATQMTPLVREAGRLLITDQRVYFQPLHNINGGARVRSHPLAHVAAVARRRSSLRPVGLELFFLDPDDTRMGNSIGGPTWDAPSAFFAFRTGEERERAVSILLRQPRIGQALSAGHDAMATAGSLLEADTRQLRLVTSAWQHGRISNMEYLLYCNLAAGRSFNDLTQWPVFPWVLSDYRSSRLNLDDPGVFRDLSKPVGALNPQRLELLRKRFREMPSGEGLPEPFLYGTHYSTPGYVMFWLVRAAPGHMLRLQNGRFDAPDRLFFDVAETWDSVAGKNHADVKELIPEFFLPDSSFLVNRHGLALGRRQNGRSVGDVLLPPWARDPDDFIAKHRAALESPTVSANLHKWIDLIFGYKQRGREAVEANNVFHPLTYEGAVDLDAVSDPMERRALEVQINEFGQTPRQLFTSPHPPRIRVPPTPNVNRLYQAQGRSAAGGGDCSRAFSLALLGPLIAVASSTGPPPDGPGPPGDASPSPPSRPSADGDGLPPPASTASASGASLRIRQLRTEGAGSSSSSSPARTPNGSRTPDSSRSEQRTTGSAESSPNRFLRSISASRIRAALGFRQSPREAAAGPGARQESPAPREEPPEPSQQQAEPPPSAGEGEGASAEARSPAPGCSSPASSAGSYATSPAGQRCRVIRAASGHVLQPEPALEPWGAAIRSRLRPLATIRAQKERINAVALSSCGGGTIYCADSGASLKALSIASRSQLRAGRCGDIPLSSLALLPAGSARTTVGGGAVCGHPTLLAGSYDNRCYAYSVDWGRQLGSWPAHDDAVSCMRLVYSDPRGGCRLLTGSWDSTVKVWRLDEGRQPWTGLGCLGRAERELSEHESAVTHLDADFCGNLLLTGTEEGVLTLWDVRQNCAAWQRYCPGDGAIGGLCLAPDGSEVVVAGSAGRVSLLELRRGGEELSHVECRRPLHCCATDGSILAAGAGGGEVLFWDLRHQRGMPPVGEEGPGPDGLYAPLAGSSHSPVTALAFALLGGEDGTCGEAGRLHVAVAHEDGVVSAFVA